MHPNRRSIIAWALVCACGPTSAADDTGQADSTSTSTSTGPSTDPGSTTTSIDTSEASSSAASSETSSTGETFTFESDEVWWELQCREDQPGVWIEVYPGHFDDHCSAPPDVSEDFVLVVVQPWDGEGGTFIVGADGPAHAAIGIDLGPTTGEVTLDVSAPFALVSATIDLATPNESISGTVDLSECGPQQPTDPCR
jgi:hypothetical protein